MEIKINLTLPEWVFLDGNSHLGDTLENRVILQHIPSFTIIELIALGEKVLEVNSPVKIKEFSYSNIYGDNEKHLLVVYSSQSVGFELDGILNEAIEFYKLFMDWEDSSLIIEETSKDN